MIDSPLHASSSIHLTACVGHNLIEKYIKMCSLSAIQLETINFALCNKYFMVGWTNVQSNSSDNA